ncbi:Lectin-related protein [Rhynchospora pubera]|uniref:Lectin-related protein n=1 Tax=Rhynchospora pubera TaxID=906938 RepID=A0AAV8EDM0_9POAL|nr:Lectin-related protein [Rhynchospora pubera]
MVINPISSRIPVLLFASSVYLSLVIQHSGLVSFDFNFSDQETATINMSIQGDASFNNVDSIGLTNTLAGFNNRFSVGRAVYNQPVLLWDSSSARRGLFNSTTGLNISANKIVAVEFDTFFNPGIDPNSTEQTDCHIGINVNTIYSTNYSIVPNSFLVGVNMTAQIEYKSRFNLLSLLLWSDTDKETKYTVKAFVDIKNLLPSMCAVGFSAATGTAAELHQIYSWSFKSTLEVNHSLAVNDKGGINARYSRDLAILFCQKYSQ